MFILIRVIRSTILLVSAIFTVLASSASPGTIQTTPCHLFVEEIYSKNRLTTLTQSDQFSQAAVDFLETCDDTFSTAEMMALFDLKHSNARRNERRYYSRNVTGTDQIEQAKQNFEDALNYSAIYTIESVTYADAPPPFSAEAERRRMALAEARLKSAVNTLKQRHSFFNKLAAKAFVEDVIARERTNYENAGESDKRAMRRYAKQVREDSEFQTEVDALATSIAPARFYQHNFDLFEWSSIKLDAFTLILIAACFGSTTAVCVLADILAGKSTKRKNPSYSKQAAVRASKPFQTARTRRSRSING